jgi:hypothetical protein
MATAPGLDGSSGGPTHGRRASVDQGVRTYLPGKNVLLRKAMSGLHMVLDAYEEHLGACSQCPRDLIGVERRDLDLIREEVRRAEDDVVGIRTRNDATSAELTELRSICLELRPAQAARWPGTNGGRYQRALEGRPGSRWGD